MENITNINVLVIGKNLVPGLSKEMGCPKIEYFDFCSSLDGEEFKVAFNDFPSDKRYKDFIAQYLLTLNVYDICLFIFDLDDKEQVKNLKSFGSDKIQDLKQFMGEKFTNLFKVFIGFTEDYLKEGIDEKNIRDLAEENNGLYLGDFSSRLTLVKTIIKNYLMQKYKKTDDEITGELTLNDEIKIKFYSVGKDINNTGCYSSYIQKIKNCSIY